MVGFKGQPKHGDEYGALKEGAALELKGALLFEVDAGEKRDEWDMVDLSKHGVKVGSFLPDVVSRPVEGKLVCLGISYHERSSTVTGLVLEEHIHDGNPVYCRVGYVDKLDPSLWGVSERRQITLI